MAVRQPREDLLEDRAGLRALEAAVRRAALEQAGQRRRHRLRDEVPSPVTLFLNAGKVSYTQVFRVF